MIYFLGFILCLGGLIFFHELGHFLVAKKEGIFVEEFGFGFPPRIFGCYKENNRFYFILGPKSVKTKATIYSLNLLPFGGFVRLFGENKDLGKGSFFSANFLTRLKVSLAGISFNFLLGLGLLIFGYLIGVPQTKESPYLVNPKIQIIAISNQSPAKNQLKLGDIILGIKENSQILTFKEIGQFQKYVKAHQGKKITLIIQRKNQRKEITVLARNKPPKGEGPIGIGLAKIGIFKPPVHLAFLYAFKDAFKISILIFFVFFVIIKNLLIKKVLISEIAGPIGIVYLGTKISELGFSYLIWFLALLSLNLAAINFLPLPAADGGRVLLLLIEKIRKKRISQKTENFINTLGFIFIIALMIVLTFRDLKRIF